MTEHRPGTEQEPTAARQQLFYALAEPTRRGIIELLARRGQLSVTDISDNFPITPPAISQHLKVLREANFVRVEKRAQQRIYKINPDAMSQLEQWVQTMTESWNARFNILDRILEKERGKSRRNNPKHKHRTS